MYFFIRVRNASVRSSQVNLNLSKNKDVIFFHCILEPSQCHYKVMRIINLMIKKICMPRIREIFFYFFFDEVY